MAVVHLSEGAVNVYLILRTNSAWYTADNTLATPPAIGNFSSAGFNREAVSIRDEFKDIEWSARYGEGGPVTHVIRRPYNAFISLALTKYDRSVCDSFFRDGTTMRPNSFAFGLYLEGRTHSYWAPFCKAVQGIERGVGTRYQVYNAMVMAIPLGRELSLESTLGSQDQDVFQQPVVIQAGSQLP